MRKRSKLNISNFHNSTFKMGYLYPCNCFEVLPGDTIQMSTSVFLRMAPMVAPVMHPTYMFIHSYFVPSRVIANQLREDGGADFDFESFITGGPDGTDAQTIPKLVLNKTNAPVFYLPGHEQSRNREYFYPNKVPLSCQKEAHQPGQEAK
jgi:hypothetical protein